MKIRVVVTHAFKLCNISCVPLIIARSNFYSHSLLKPENGVSQNLHSHSYHQKIVMPKFFLKMSREQQAHT